MSQLPTLDPLVTQSALLRAYSDANSEGFESDFNGERTGKFQIFFSKKIYIGKNIRFRCVHFVISRFIDTNRGFPRLIFRTI